MSEKLTRKKIMDKTTFITVEKRKRSRKSRYIIRYKVAEVDITAKIVKSSVRGVSF